MDQDEKSIILKDGPICIALIQQKDKTKYQSAFYDQSIHICIASSATLKKILKDNLQIKNCLKAAFLNAGLPPHGYPWVYSVTPRVYSVAIFLSTFISTFRR